MMLLVEHLIMTTKYDYIDGRMVVYVGAATDENDDGNDVDNKNDTDNDDDEDDDDDDENADVYTYKLYIYIYIYQSTIFTEAVLGGICFNEVSNCLDPNAGCDILALDESFCEGVCTCTDGFVPDSTQICNATCVARKCEQCSCVHIVICVHV